MVALGQRFAVASAPPPDRSASGPYRVRSIASL